MFIVKSPLTKQGKYHIELVNYKSQTHLIMPYSDATVPTFCQPFSPLTIEKKQRISI